jgi:hypothetical protein
MPNGRILVVDDEPNKGGDAAFSVTLPPAPRED